MKIGLFRLSGTSARIELKEDGQFALFQPGAVIRTEMFVGALEQLWESAPVPEVPGRIFRKRTGMSGAIDLRSFRNRWQKKENGNQVFNVITRLADLHISMYGKVNDGAQGHIGEMLALTRNFNLPSVDVRLLAEEPMYVHIRTVWREIEGLRCAILQEVAPDHTIISEIVTEAWDKKEFLEPVKDRPGFFFSRSDQALEFPKGRFYGHPPLPEWAAAALQITPCGVTLANARTETEGGSL